MSVKTNLTRAEAEFLLETIRACQTELRELIYEKEWYVTEVVDRLLTAREILEIPDGDNDG